MKRCEGETDKGIRKTEDDIAIWYWNLLVLARSGISFLYGARNTKVMSTSGGDSTGPLRFYYFLHLHVKGFPAIELRRNKDRKKPQATRGVLRSVDFVSSHSDFYLGEVLETMALEYEILRRRIRDDDHDGN